MMTDSMKPEDEIKVSLELINTDDLTTCQLCGMDLLKHELTAHWRLTCTYFHPKGLVIHE